MIQEQETVCSIVVEIPGDPTVGIFGETASITFDSGYVLNEKEDQTYLIEQVKDFFLNLYGESVKVYLFSEDGSEIWIR